MQWYWRQHDITGTASSTGLVTSRQVPDRVVYHAMNGQDPSPEHEHGFTNSSRLPANPGQHWRCEKTASIELQQTGLVCTIC